MAHGTIAAKIEIVDPATGAKVTSCRSGTLRWAARSAPGRVYAGLTSARLPIVIERSRSGRKVNSMWVSWAAPCQNAGGWAVAEELVNFPVSGAGRFGDTFSDEMKVDGVGTNAFAYRLERQGGRLPRGRHAPGGDHREGRRGRDHGHLRHHAGELERALHEGRGAAGQAADPAGRRLSSRP